MTRIGAAGDPRRTMALLWRSPAPSQEHRPGPKAALSLDEIVDDAINLADEAGDGSISLRALAARLGCTPMALYTYLTDRRELLDLMYDRVHADMPEPIGDDWRSRVRAWSEAILECYLRHPWVVQVSFARSVLGPHEQRALELLLEALAPAGLEVADRATLVAALFGLARSMASTITDARQAAEADDEGAWWAARTTALNEVVPDFAERFPRSVALTGAPASAKPGGAPERTARRTDDLPWLEQPTRDAFARAVGMLLDGAATAAARERQGRETASRGHRPPVDAIQ